MFSRASAILRFILTSPTSSAKSHPSLPHPHKPHTDIPYVQSCSNLNVNYFSQGKISQFAPFGAGVTSYFKLLKFFSWSFLVVSLLTLPHILININGGSITTVTTNTDRMSRTTVGNIGGGSGNYSSMVGGRVSVTVSVLPLGFRRAAVGHGVVTEGTRIPFASLSLEEISSRIELRHEQVCVTEKQQTGALDTEAKTEAQILFIPSPSSNPNAVLCFDL